MTYSQSAQQLAKLVSAAKEAKKSRTVNYQIQNVLGVKWFHARGIQDQMDFSYETMFNNPDLLVEAIVAGTKQRGVSQESLTAFTNSLNNQLGNLIDLPYIDNPITSEPTVEEPEPTPSEPQGEPQGTPIGKMERIGSENKNQPRSQQPEQKPTYKTDATDQGVNAGFSLNIPIMDILKQVVDEKTDVLTIGIENKIKEIAKTLQPNIISINNKEVGTVEGKLHKKFDEAMNKLVTLGRIFLAGDTGSGKTHLAKQLANGLKLPFGFISLTAGISEAHLTGRMLMDGSYVSTQFVEIFENGGVFLMDEIDSADANTLLTLNTALSNGELSIPNRKDKPIAKMHKDFYLIASANTWGNGGIEYSGREVIDKATMGRFSLGKIHVDYDTKLELQLTENSEYTKKLQDIRKKLKGTQRSISTRTIIDAHKLKLSGNSWESVLDSLTVDFTDAEKNKVMS